MIGGRHNALRSIKCIMIIASSPTRISFGSADHTPFAERFNGVALNACIDRRVYAILRKRSSMEQYRFRIAYSRTELCETIADIEHPLIRGALDMLKIDQPLEILYAADVPATLGLATSSALAVALLAGLYYMQGECLDPEGLFEQAYRLEREYVGQPGGFQDYAVAYGGINYMTGFPHNIKRWAVKLCGDGMAELENHLSLVYTGSQGDSATALGEQLKRLNRRELTNETHRLKELVNQMYALMFSPDFKPMGLAPYLNETWELKKTFSAGMSTPHIMELEQKIRQVCPSVGLRLVGSGGGRGLLLVLSPPNSKAAICAAVAPQRCFDVKFDQEGVRVYSLR
jgi:D-glycero-alpha-D-manno-heptose-7-phosphate kinase